jgi:hypothetical protein
MENYEFSLNSKVIQLKGLTPEQALSKINAAFKKCKGKNEKIVSGVFIFISASSEKV